MHSKRRPQPADDRLQMTAMIDVTFLLLIFFLCTLRFRTLEGILSSYLPRDVGLNQMPELKLEPLELVIGVVDPGARLDPVTGGAWSGRGRFETEGRVISYRVGPHTVSGGTASPRGLPMVIAPALVILLLLRRRHLIEGLLAGIVSAAVLGLGLGLLACALAQ